MGKIENIWEIEGRLGFREFDIIEKYGKSFDKSEVGRVDWVFGFEGMGKSIGVWEEGVGGRKMLRGWGKIGVMVVKG